MNNLSFNKMKKSMGFLDEDARHVRSLAKFAQPFIQPIVEQFYDFLLKDDNAHAIFTGGEDQIVRLRVALANWLEELFVGIYDKVYYENRLRIGHTHVRVGLPQHYMFVGMQLVWKELESRLQETTSPDIQEKLRSLHKLLMLDLTIMLDSYKDRYSEQIRETERSAVEEKLTRAEHLAEIGQLAASLAHEIKNPLAGISGAIQIMRETMSIDDPHRPILLEVLGQISRLDAVVKDLLFYARPTPPRKERASIDDIVIRVLHLLREEPAMQRLHIEQNNNQGQAIAYVDSLQIEQLLLNLLLNAAHASADEGVIELTLGQTEDHVQLIIKDHGAGMSAETIAHAFEAFFTTKAKGTGLGLSICRRIVEAHGGRIKLESEINVGTTVKIDLPCQDHQTSKENR